MKFIHLFIYNFKQINFFRTSKVRFEHKPFIISTVVVSFEELTVREMCPYSHLFRSAFSRIRTEYGEIRRISLYSVRMRANADQNNSEYVQLLCSVILLNYYYFSVF